MKQMFDTIIGRVLGLTYDIDIINVCSLRCPTCPVGYATRPNGAVMSVEGYKTILRHMETEKIWMINLYSWSEPLLHKDLHRFIEASAPHDVRVSTTLNGWKADIGAVLSQPNLKEFRISFSGFRKYEDTHRGGDLSNVYNRLRTVAEQNTNMICTLVWHAYRHNADEEETARKIADELHFKFESHDALFMGAEKIATGSYTDEDRQTISMLNETPEETLARIPRSRHCKLQTRKIALDAEGKISLCCATYSDDLKLGHFVDRPVRDWQRLIRSHPFCGTCMDSGANVYLVDSYPRAGLRSHRFTGADV